MNAWEEKIIEQQKAEERKAKEIAKGLKEDGIPVGIIAKNTGLTIEDVEKL